ncbi:ribbon-helix-helix domain-containing protein [Actinomyces graevenitzii]
MFRQLRILAAKRDTSVTALVVEAIKKTYPEINDK